MTLDPRASLAVPVGFQRTWRERPSVVSHAVMRWTTASFYLLGGALVSLVAGLLGAGADGRGVAVVGAIAGALGLLVAVLGHRCPRWAFHVFAVLGTALVTVLVLLGGGGAASIALSGPYVFVIVNTVFLFPLWQSVCHVVLTEVACAVSLVHVGATSGHVVLVMGSTLGMGAMVAWLARAASAADEDPLTGLLNRRGFDKRLEEVLRTADREGGQVALAVLDVDQFKQVNDVEGHLAGDRLLLACARAWVDLVPEDAHLARYGGDEFTLLLPGTPLGRAADLVDELRRHTPEEVTISAGVAAWQRSDSGSMLISRADVALYEAKTTGRDRSVAYGDPHRAASELETAIAAGQLVIAYQPIVRLRTGEVVGSEALVRWRHPDKGLILPDHFIPEAERTGAIRSLGRWLVAEVCRTVMEGPEPRRSVGINVSAQELRSPEYAAVIVEQLRLHRMSGDLLVLEVTEGAFDDDDPHVLTNLAALREADILVAIDDFGSGYSSLRRLAHLPIDIIKIDGALVRAIRPDSHDAPILEAIATMGRSLGVRLVAERVETAHQVEVLVGLGYELGQGFHFGRPALD